MKELNLNEMEKVKGGSCASGIITMWMVGGVALEINLLEIRDNHSTMLLHTHRGMYITPE